MTIECFSEKHALCWYKDRPLTCPPFEALALFQVVVADAPLGAVRLAVFRAGENVAGLALEVAVAQAAPAARLAGAVARAGLLVAVAGAGINTEGDVETRHVVRHVAVKVHQHTSARANHLRNPLHVVPKRQKYRIYIFFRAEERK